MQEEGWVTRVICNGKLVKEMESRCGFLLKEEIRIYDDSMSEKEKINGRKSLDSM